MKHIINFIEIASVIEQIIVSAGITPSKITVGYVDDVENSISIFSIGPITYLGINRLNSVYQQDVQIRIKSSLQYNEGETLNYKIMSLFIGESYNINNIHVIDSAIKSALPIGVDSSGRYEFTVNVRLTISKV